MQSQPAQPVTHLASAALAACSLFATGAARRVLQTIHKGLPIPCLGGMGLASRK